jgi:hypothetical protein
MLAMLRTVAAQTRKDLRMNINLVTRIDNQQLVISLNMQHAHQWKNELAVNCGLPIQMPWSFEASLLTSSIVLCFSVLGKDPP